MADLATLLGEAHVEVKLAELVVVLVVLAPEDFESEYLLVFSRQELNSALVSRNADVVLLKLSPVSRHEVIVKKDDRIVDDRRRK